MPLATSGVATALIAYKAWCVLVFLTEVLSVSRILTRKYRHAHLKAFGKSSPQTRIQKLMILLIESGVVYMLFFVRDIRTTVPRMFADGLFGSSCKC